MGCEAAMRALCAADLLRQHAAPTYCVFWAGNLLGISCD